MGFREKIHSRISILEKEFRVKGWLPFLTTLSTEEKS